MKKSTYILLCLLVVSFMVVTGQHQTKVNRQAVRTSVNRGQDPRGIHFNKDEFPALKQLKAKIQPLQLASHKTSNLEGNSFQQQLSKSFRPSVMRNKLPQQRVMKYRLDSLVFYDYNQSNWIKEEKQSITYNLNQQVIKDEKYTFDVANQMWANDTQSITTYDGQGRMVSYVEKVWIEVLATARWVLGDSLLISYDEKGNILSEEWYTDELNEDTGEYVLYGYNKYTTNYDQHNNETGGISYIWDEVSQAWINDSKYDCLYQDDMELMLAYYNWNKEEERWEGSWKFEHFPLQGYSMMGAVHYYWNDVTQQWYVDSKEEYEVGQNAHGDVITLTYFSADFETKVVYPQTKTVFSDPAATVNDYNDNFKSIVVYEWDTTTSVWLNKDKTSNSFDSFGNLLVGIDSMWVVSSTGDQQEWVIKRRIDNTVNGVGNVTESIVTTWNAELSQGLNAIIQKTRQLFDYTAANLQSERIHQTWDFTEESWANVSRYTFAYDAAGYVVLEHWYEGYSKATEAWVPLHKYERAFDHQGDLSTYVFYQWIPNTDSWRRMMSQVYETNVNGDLIHAANTYWDDDLNMEVVYLNIEREYDSNGNLVLETDMNSNIEFDGMLYNVITKGTKHSYVYHTSYPRGLVSEMQYSWDNGTKDWQLKRKSALTFNFEVPRSEMLLPFDEDDESSREERMYFNWMPIELIFSALNPTNSSWELDQKVICYFTLSEFSAVAAINSSPLVVAPNPVADYLSITLPADRQQANFKLLDMYGRVVMEKTMVGEMQMDMSHLNKGIYFYQVRSGTNTYQGKLIKK